MRQLRSYTGLLQIVLMFHKCVSNENHKTVLLSQDTAVENTIYFDSVCTYYLYVNYLCIFIVFQIVNT
jgi:hypothetical protein